MRFWLKVTIMGAALGGAAWGSACTQASYAAYESMVSSCTVGDEAFGNFSALSFSGTLGLTVSTSDILITPQVVGNVDELVFTYQNLPVPPNASSTTAEVSANQILGYSFNYVVTPIPNPVIDIQMISDIGTTGTGNVSAVKDALVGGSLFESAANNGSSIDTFPTLISGPITPVPGTSAPFTVQDAISLQGQTGTAEQLDYTNLFTEGAVSTSTPEPATTLLVGTGLLCFGLTRRYRARR